jgi:hypothetical protein
MLAEDKNDVRKRKSLRICGPQDFIQAKFPFLV